MIQANELRINNIVQCYGHFVIVTTIGDYGISFDKPTIKRHVNFINPTLQPITLTEEILLKCGFTECKNGIEIELNHGVKLNCLFNSNLITLEVYESRCKTDIKYIHQLQNLYFSLTGKELEVKL